MCGTISIGGKPIDLKERKKKKRKPLGVLVEYVKDVAASGKATLSRAKIIKQTGDTAFITGRERRRKTSAGRLSHTAF